MDNKGRGVILDFSAQKRRTFLVTGVVFVVLLIIPGLIGVAYYQADQSLTAQIYLQQQTLVNLATSALEIKINRLVEIGELVASSDQISKDAANGHWSDAANFARDMENDVAYDTFIDRIIFYDADGIQQSAYPELKGGLGTAATSTDWYRLLSSGGNFYVSGVSQRISVPRINVVSIITPIKTGGTINGFSVLQIPARNFLEFGTDLSLGTYGFAYIVDSKGNLVAHPQFSSQNGEVVNYSFVPAVKEIMAGKTGVMIVYNQNGTEKSIVGYEPLQRYRWGVVIQELYDEVFAPRDSILFSYLIEMITAFVFDLLFSYLVLRLLLAKAKKYQKP